MNYNKLFSHGNIAKGFDFKRFNVFTRNYSLFLFLRISGLNFGQTVSPKKLSKIFFSRVEINFVLYLKIRYDKVILVLNVISNVKYLISIFFLV